MELTFYAQAAFRIVGQDGVRIVIDPYEASERLRYDPTFDEADIVVVTHEHGDHNNVAAVPGDPEVVRGAGRHVAGGITFEGIGCYHDGQQGAQRGPNAIITFTLDGLRIAHFGDLGHELDDEHYRQLGALDVVIVPTGGGPTLEPELVWAMVERIAPKVAIPCHFKTSEIDLPLAPLETFLDGKDAVRRVGGSTVTLTAETLPKTTEIVVLEHSR